MFCDSSFVFCQLPKCARTRIVPVLKDEIVLKMCVVHIVEVKDFITSITLRFRILLLEVKLTIFSTKFSNHRSPR